MCPYRLRNRVRVCLREMRRGEKGGEKDEKCEEESELNRLS